MLPHTFLCDNICGLRWRGSLFHPQNVYEVHVVEMKSALMFPDNQKQILNMMLWSTSRLQDQLREGYRSFMEFNN